MFKFFKKKYTSTVIKEDKEWIETRLKWFIEVFGMDMHKGSPFILPQALLSKYSDLEDLSQFSNLFEEICGYWGVNPDEIVVKFFDDLISKEWTTWVRHEKITDPAGLYYQIYSAEEKQFNVYLAKSNLQSPDLLVAVLSHELAHVKLLGGNYVAVNAADMEPLTDLATIYFGFGLFFANSRPAKVNGWLRRPGYLPDEMISYANALMCYIFKIKNIDIFKVKNKNVNEYFIQNYEYLMYSHDTLLDEDTVAASWARYKTNEAIEKAFEEENYDAVIAIEHKALEKDKYNPDRYNNIGYAYLLKKNYLEAISYFNLAIDREPFWDYPYNNRGYCKLQLGDAESALVDIHSAVEMNSENSFAWRNMGLYYMNKKEYEKALEHFQEAEKLNLRADALYHYLALAHERLGNIEETERYRKKSQDSKEYVGDLFVC